MTKGISLHVGLNHVDPKKYGGWEGRLRFCHNDANDMQAIAKKNRFESGILLDEEVTLASIKKHFMVAAKKLQPGDIFFFSYSGHGTQVPDKSNDEADGKDEAWVLFDQLLIDDEIGQFKEWFQPGVRILIVSDSCHSGTMLKHMSDNELQHIGKFIPYQSLPPKITNKNNVPHDGRLAKKGATVISLTACQDNQFAVESNGNGLFTAAIKRAIGDNGRFNGNYFQLYKAISGQMPPNQSPNYRVAGPKHPTFTSEPAFTVEQEANANHFIQNEIAKIRHQNEEMLNCLMRIETRLQTIDPEWIVEAMAELRNRTRP